MNSASLGRSLAATAMNGCRVMSSGGGRTICFEGNIASGKTSCINGFTHMPDVEVVSEPVSKWRNVRGHNTLDLMYRDPSRWSLTFQTYVQLTMLDAHTKAQTKANKLMERSIFSAKYCFVENLHRCGKMPDVEYAVLSEWFDWIVKRIQLPVDLIVYLRTDPQVVSERIRKRSRTEETSIKMDYLITLHELHEDWLLNKRFPLPCPVVTVDANEDTEKVTEQLMHKYNILQRPNFQPKQDAISIP